MDYISLYSVYTIETYCTLTHIGGESARMYLPAQIPISCDVNWREILSAERLEWSLCSFMNKTKPLKRSKTSSNLKELTICNTDNNPFKLIFSPRRAAEMIMINCPSKLNAKGQLHTSVLEIILLHNFTANSCFN